MAAGLWKAAVCNLCCVSLYPNILLMCETKLIKHFMVVRPRPFLYCKFILNVVSGCERDEKEVVKMISGGWHTQESLQ